MSTNRWRKKVRKAYYKYKRDKYIKNILYIINIILIIYLLFIY